MSEEQRITDDSDLRKYRTELPNLADDELNPFECRLYVHYKRVGDCWESVRTTAQKTGMSVGQVVKSRKSLEANGWIRCEDDTAHGTIRISIIDRWGENFQKYAGIASKNRTGRSPGEHQRSPGEHKKEPVKKEPNLPQEYTPVEKARRPIWDAVTEACRIDPSKIPDSLKSSIGKAERELKLAGWSPPDIVKFAAWWYANDWRAKKGESMKPRDVPSGMAEMGWRNGNGKSSPDKGGPTPEVLEWAAGIKAKRAAEGIR